MSAAKVEITVKDVGTDNATINVNSTAVLAVVYGQAPSLLSVEAVQVAAHMLKNVKGFLAQAVKAQNTADLPKLNLVSEATKTEFHIWVWNPKLGQVKVDTDSKKLAAMLSGIPGPDRGAYYLTGAEQLGLTMLTSVDNYLREVSKAISQRARAMRNTLPLN